MYHVFIEHLFYDINEDENSENDNFLYESVRKISTCHQRFCTFGAKLPKRTEPLVSLSSETGEIPQCNKFAVIKNVYV